jgi:hypothetical protein
VFLPLSAMFYFSFLVKTPLLQQAALLTLKQYHHFSRETSTAIC